MSSVQQSTPARKPAWHGYFADPFVLAHQGMYYAFGTGSDQSLASEPEHRAFAVLRSADLANWEFVGGALVPPAGREFEAYWAPEVAARDGAFYMYYSAGGRNGEQHRLRLAIANHPAGPYIDRGELPLGEEFSIDASPFRDPADGRWYLYFAKDFFDERVGTGAAVVPLADDMFTPAGPVTTVVRASADWQIFERQRTWYNRVWPAWHTVEGPFVVARNGRYYCFFSGGRWEGPQYGVSYAVADSPLGPFVEEARTDGPPLGPSLLRSDAERLGPGHNSVVTTQAGDTFIVYHAWDVAWTARRMFIERLEWDDHGPRPLR